MTREEEIEKASVHHLFQYDYSYEEGEHLDFYIKGFTEGAKWADENPKNVWYDVKEGPNKPYPIIIEIGDDIDPTYEFITVDGKDEKFWKFITSEMDITRWAYINDLLPKKINNHDKRRRNKSIRT